MESWSRLGSANLKTNIHLVLKGQPPPKSMYCNINCHQNQHTFGAAIPTTTKINIELSARRSETNGRILVIIQIFCRSINTPSSRPTALSFLNAITWAATGQTLGILASTKGTEKLFPQSLVPTVRSTRWDYNKSQSPEELIKCLSMYCELSRALHLKLLYTPIAGLKGNPVTQSWLQTHILLQLHQESDSPKYYLYLLKVEDTPGWE